MSTYSPRYWTVNTMRLNLLNFGCVPSYQENFLLIFSLNGGYRMPFSVMIAAISLWSVTSKAGLYTLTPFGAVGRFPKWITSSLPLSSTPLASFWKTTKRSLSVSHRDAPSWTHHRHCCFRRSFHPNRRNRPEDDHRAYISRASVLLHAPYVYPRWL